MGWSGAFHGGHWWDFRSRAWAFCSVGQGLGPNFRTVIVFNGGGDPGKLEVLGEGPGHLCGLRGLRLPLFDYY